MRHDRTNLFDGSLALLLQLLSDKRAIALALQLRELTLVQIIQRGLHWNDPVAERAIVLEVLLRDDGGALRLDEHLLLQLADILADGVASHAGRLGDLVCADDAVERFAVFSIEQVGVDRKRTRREMELKDFHRQRKEIFGVLPAHPAERDALAAFDLREPTARERTQMLAHGVLAHAERAADAAAGLADERRDEEAEIREVRENHQRARCEGVVEQSVRQRKVILERAAPGVWIVGQWVTSFVVFGLRRYGIVGAVSFIYSGAFQLPAPVAITSFCHDWLGLEQNLDESRAAPAQLSSFCNSIHDFFHFLESGATVQFTYVTAMISTQMRY